MAKYQLKAAQAWLLGDTCINEGDVVATIESELAPMILFDGERSGRLQVQYVDPDAEEADEEQPDSDSVDSP